MEPELEELELELELLELLELLPGSRGGGVVGNGCSVAAAAGVVVDPEEAAGASGGFAGLVGSPGNGNCSAVEGWLAAGAGGVQGLEFFEAGWVCF